MQALKRYIVLTLALLITISATGVNVSLHWCCGKVKDFTLLGESKPCEMGIKSVAKECASTSAASFVHKGKTCCNDQEISVHNDVEAPLLKSQSANEHAPYLLFAYTFLKHWSGLRPSLGAVTIPPADVPLGKEPLTILFQQFRI